MSTFIIAEAGVNHNGDMKMAKALVDAAVEAGADAIKFQSFIPKEVASVSAPKADYQNENTSGEESQLQMLEKLQLTKEMHFELVDYCKERQIQFLSTPFDLKSLDFLTEELQLDLIKVGSGDINFAPLLMKAARLKKKVILSTGMCTLGDIEEALGVLAFGYLSHSEEEACLESFEKAYASEEGQKVLAEYVSLLHCTSEYPAPFQDVNLKTMQTLSQAFELPVGFSDHTMGIAVPIAAVALGARIVEKHMTLDCTLPGPDHKASLPPHLFKEMVRSIREVEDSLGNSHKFPRSSESKNKTLVRRSIVARKAIKKDSEISVEDLSFKRPGHGLSPMLLWKVKGHKAQRNYAEDEIL